MRSSPAIAAFPIALAMLLVPGCGGAPAPAIAPPLPPTPPPSATMMQWSRARDVLLDLRAWDASNAQQHRDVAAALDERFTDFTFKELATFEVGGQKHEVAIFTHGPTGMEFSLVPGGSFVMGSPPVEEGRSDNEVATEVAVWPFLIARTEVTQLAWAHTMTNTNPSRYKGDKRPVDSVKWQGASDFCGRNRLDLPTEAEWEYATRGGGASAFFTGTLVASLDGYANASDAYLQAHQSEVPYGISNFNFQTDINDGYATTAPVASFKPNAFGLFDMIGNVMEWCEGICPLAQGGGGKYGEPARPLRGGNWASTLPTLRSASRHGDASGNGYDGVGFRPVKRLAE